MTPDHVADIREQGDARLWSAVILQALSDATAPLPKSDGARRRVLHVRRSARAWFESASVDFREVCTFAGMDPERIRAVALKKFEEVDNRGDDTPRFDLIEHDGERLTAAEWSRRTGLAPNTIVKRLQKGLTVAEALTPNRLEPQAKFYTHEGQTHTLVEWAKITGIKATTIQGRLNDGWSLADALTVTTKQARTRAAASRMDALKKMHAARKAGGKRYEFNGRAMTLASWSAATGINSHTLRNRISAGWSIERALTTPSQHGAKEAA